MGAGRQEPGARSQVAGVDKEADAGHDHDHRGAAGGVWRPGSRVGAAARRTGGGDRPADPRECAFSPQPMGGERADGRDSGEPGELRAVDSAAADRAAHSERAGYRFAEPSAGPAFESDDTDYAAGCDPAGLAQAEAEAGGETAAGLTAACAAAERAESGELRRSSADAAGARDE